MSLEHGTCLGPYEVIELLGSGGMGEVYRARDPRLERDVAIKVLPPAVANSPTMLGRFEREARAASALNHPNILTIHDFESTEGSAYLVMELLRGSSLRDLLTRGPLPTHKTLDIAIQIAKGLAASHGAGIVHRDLKPGNLFVTRDGVVKILDFGLVRVIEEQAPETSEDDPTVVETSEGLVLGTLGYMAPEQVRGEKVDARADLFAFGCVLYEMATGKRAFSRGSRVVTLTAILEGEPEDPASLGTPLPLALDRIIRHCLEKDPERRFQSAQDLLFALEEAESSTSGSIPVRLSTKPNRKPLMGAVAAVVVIVIVLAFWWTNRRPGTPVEPSTRIESLAVLPLTNLSGDPDQEYFADGMTEALIAELAKLQGLKVISRTSVMRFKGTTMSLPEVATELGVHGVIEGSVLQDGDLVRITVQLIDGRADHHLWAESYTRPARDILQLQGEVARSIARQVNIAVSPEEERALQTAREVNPEAHRLFMEATELLRRGSTQLEQQARIRDLVQRGLELDSEYAPLHTLQAEMDLQRAFTGYEPGISACAKAREDLGRALDLDPASKSARAVDARMKWACEYDWDGARAQYEDLLLEAPGDADLHNEYAVSLSMSGHHQDAIEHSKIAYERDPLSDWVGGQRVQFLTNARRYREAVDVAEEVLRFSPDSVFVKWMLGRAQLAKGDLDDALSTFLSRDVSAPAMNPKVGVLYARAGRSDEARSLLNYLLEKREQQYVPALMIAAIYANLDETEEAFEWLDTGYEEHDFFMQSLLVDPDFDGLRDDGRFQELLRRMNLM